MTTAVGQRAVCLSAWTREMYNVFQRVDRSIPWILHSDLLDPEWTVWVFCSQFTVSHTYHTLVRFFCVLLTSVLALCDFSTFSLSLCPSFLLSVTAGLGDRSKKAAVCLLLKGLTVSCVLVTGISVLCCITKNYSENTVLGTLLHQYHVVRLERRGKSLHNERLLSFSAPWDDIYCLNKSFDLD